MNKRLKRFVECILIFLSVGTFYYIIEVIYKGITSNNWHSHWTMFILSGAMGIVAMLLNDIFTYEIGILSQSFICTIICTTLEYFVGINWNSDYSIWCYLDMPMNLDGQICLTFSCIWFVLFTIIIPILDYVEWKVFDYKIETPPYYKIFGKKIFQFK
jgi:uncharacterized membrane protein